MTTSTPTIPKTAQLRIKRGRVRLWRVHRAFMVSVGDEPVLTSKEPSEALSRFDFENALQWQPQEATI